MYRVAAWLHPGGVFPFRGNAPLFFVQRFPMPIALSIFAVEGSIFPIESSATDIEMSAFVAENPTVAIETSMDCGSHLINPT